MKLPWLDFGRYAADVPKNLLDNIAYREWAIRECDDNADAQEDVRVMCHRDPLYYVNAWCYTSDTRLAETGAPTTIPWVLYEYQEEAFARLLDAFGTRDIGIDKSRAMGASWLCLLLMDWAWRELTEIALGLVSRNQDYVEKPGDPKSLFWKLDFLWKTQPTWLRPRRKRGKLHVGNMVNGSTIDGESTTGDLLRGGRLLAVLLDEFAAFEVPDGYRAMAASRDASPCRIFNSTTQGPGNAYHDVIHGRADSECGFQPITIIKMHWTLHPEKRRGLYKGEPGKLTLYDANYKYPEKYPFLSDGKLRSPYYDAQWLRAVSALEIARELDMDPAAAGGAFFSSSLLTEARMYVRPPYHVGEIDYDRVLGEWRGWLPEEKGRLKVWRQLDENNRPVPKGRCVIGADISAGTGASNTALCVFSIDTNEKVAEWVDSHMMAHDAARYAAALGYWFRDADDHPAMIVYEANAGPGRNFGDTLRDLRYPRIYYRKSERTAMGGGGVPTLPGWQSTRDTKRILLETYRRALMEGKFMNRSAAALRECEYYTYVEGGVEYTGELNLNDPSGARANHGDRVIADALCWMLKAELPCRGAPVSEEQVIPPACLWRRNEALARARDLAAFW